MSFVLVERIVWVSVGILVFLFMFQRMGTDKVGYAFAPIIFVWFIFIAGIGIYNFIKYDPLVIKALNPKYILDYFRRNHKNAWISLGGVVLCTTGQLVFLSIELDTSRGNVALFSEHLFLNYLPQNAGTEALFADVGHFSVRSIRISTCAVTYPALILAYTGQAAYLSKRVKSRCQFDCGNGGGDATVEGPASSQPCLAFCRLSRAGQGMFSVPILRWRRVKISNSILGVTNFHLISCKLTSKYSNTKESRRENGN